MKGRSLQMRSTSGNEAHVQHAVGFVDHQDIDLGQHQPAALEMIEQPAGRGDQHIDAAIQLLGLVVHRDAADQKRMGELGIFAVAVEAFRHLVGQFAGGLQHQGARHARLGAAAASISIMGRVKLAVLPVPVWAMPIRSRRCSTMGNALGLDRAWGWCSRCRPPP